MTELVTVRGLSVGYEIGRTVVPALCDVDLDVREGETYGLVGQSGSGKSTLAMTLAGFAPRGMRLTASRLEVGGHDLLRLRGGALRSFRRRVIGMVHQEPSRALNPTATIGAQLTEAHRLQGMDATEARSRVVDSMADVGLTDPLGMRGRYPHELSGGQQQRVMIAMALAMRPRLLILDEPTTGLDGPVQTRVRALIARLQDRLGFACLLITHDVRHVAAFCSRVSVLPAGRVVRSKSFVRTLPSMSDAGADGAPRIFDGSRRAPTGSEAEPLLHVHGVAKRYGAHQVLHDVDIRVGRGETLGIIGETGSGKSTLAKIIAGVTPHTGSVLWNAAAARRPVQMVFQSPDASLNPRRTVRQVLARAIELLEGDVTPERLAERTGLPIDTLDRLPFQLSGGQKQRVAIARAMAGNSPLVICDEPTSGLDLPAQESIVRLLIDLQEESGISYLFISHDLSIINRIAHRIAVLHRGRIVETGPTGSLIDHPRHRHTRELVQAAARLRAAGSESP